MGAEHPGRLILSILNKIEDVRETPWKPSIVYFD